MSACITQEFCYSAGTYSSDGDYAPSDVTDRESHAGSDPNGNTTGLARKPDASTAGNPDAPTTGPTKNLDAPTSGDPTVNNMSGITTLDAGRSSSYVLPRDIQPLPKAGPWKMKVSNIKRGNTKILTDHLETQLQKPPEKGRMKQRNSLLQQSNHCSQRPQKSRAKRCHLMTVHCPVKVSPRWK